MASIDEIYGEVVKRQAYICEEYCRWHSEGNKCESCILSKSNRLAFSMSDDAKAKIGDEVLTDGKELVSKVMVGLHFCLDQLFGVSNE